MLLLNLSWDAAMAAHTSSNLNDLKKDLEIETVQQLITGTVLDKNALPLPRAPVMEARTSNGTSTDFDGNFSLELAAFPAQIEVNIFKS